MASNVKLDVKVNVLQQIIDLLNSSAKIYAFGVNLMKEYKKSINSSVKRQIEAIGQKYDDMYWEFIGIRHNSNIEQFRKLHKVIAELITLKTLFKGTLAQLPFMQPIEEAYALLTKYVSDA